jgi:hypothetical protein
MKRRNTKAIRSANDARRSRRRDGASLLYPGLLFVALPMPCDVSADDDAAHDDITCSALDFVLRTSHVSLSPIAMGGMH